jgi:hypothetical protein
MEPIKIVYVIDRRTKKRYSHGKTAPNFLPVVKEVQAEANRISKSV